MMESTQETVIVPFYMPRSRDDVQSLLDKFLRQIESLDWQERCVYANIKFLQGACEHPARGRVEHEGPLEVAWRCTDCGREWGE